MNPRNFYLFILSVLIASAAVTVSVSALAQEHGSGNDEGFDDTASVTLEDNPFGGDEAPPSMIQHKATAPAQGPTENFTVKTWRIGSFRKAAPTIQLITPGHNSKFTPGVVRFAWKTGAKSKRRHIFDFVLEKLDAGKKAVQPTTLEKININLKSGNYRWQVVNEKTHLASHWRYFKVIEMKSQSLTELYRGPSPGENTSRYSSRTASPRHVSAHGEKKYASKSQFHSHSKSQNRPAANTARNRKYEESANGVKNARRNDSGQPRPSSVSGETEGAAKTEESNFQDTTEQALAQDAGIPGGAARTPNRGKAPKAQAKPVQNTETRHENVKQARKAPPPKTRKAAPEPHAPAETPARQAPPAPEPKRETASQAPAKPAVKTPPPRPQNQSSGDERQRELDNLKFDE